MTSDEQHSSHGSLFLRYGLTTRDLAPRRLSADLRRAIDLAANTSPFGELGRVVYGCTLANRATDLSESYSNVASRAPVRFLAVRIPRNRGTDLMPRSRIPVLLEFPSLPKAFLRVVCKNLKFANFARRRPPAEVQ